MFCFSINLKKGKRLYKEVVYIKKLHKIVYDVYMSKLWYRRAFITKKIVNKKQRYPLACLSTTTSLDYVDEKCHL